MPYHVLTPEQVIYVVGERRKGRKNGDIAAELGVDSSTVSRAASRMGATPGRSQSLRGIEVPIQQAILDFVRKTVKPMPRPRARKRRAGEFMLSIGLIDAHIGSYAWGLETGEDWDVDIAVKRVLDSVDDMMKELAPYEIAKIVVPIGHDVCHTDGARMTTAFGDHHLDVDTRFARMYTAVLYALSYLVEQALEICDDVELLFVPGNHDTSSSYTMCVALQQRYLRDGRVKVDIGPSPRKYRRYGGTLLGFCHGAHMNINNLSSAIAVETKEDWAQATYREVQIGDKHQRWEKSYANAIPGGGILIRRIGALCAMDYWTYSKAFLGEAHRSLECFRYDELGFRGSHVVYVAHAGCKPCEYFERIKKLPPKPRRRG